MTKNERNLSRCCHSSRRHISAKQFIRQKNQKHSRCDQNKQNQTFAIANQCIGPENRQLVDLSITYIYYCQRYRIRINRNQKANNKAQTSGMPVREGKSKPRNRNIEKIALYGIWKAPSRLQVKFINFKDLVIKKTKYITEERLTT